MLHYQKTITAGPCIAPFSYLSINKTGTGYTLTATDGSLGSATSANFNITPAAADHLVFAQQPTTTFVQQTITPAVKVRVLDRFDNLVTGDTSDVTIAIAFNPSIGALHGTLAKAAVAGVATFNDLSIDASGLGYTLGVIDGTLQGAT